MIGRARPDDWAEIRRICCETGDGGRPIAEARWPFFGEYWVGPYARLRPEWGYVAREDAGAVVGYLTGCADTREFNRARAWSFRLPLLARVAAREFAWNADTRRFVRRAMGWDQGPEQKFGRQSAARLLRDYPAHLHMNLRPAARGLGAGRALVERYVADLRARAIAGIHLYCGDGPRGFYAKAGFETLDTIEFVPGVLVHAMGRAI